MKDMFTLLQIVQGDIPKLMGYTWEGEMPILLNDALGRLIPLPLVLCSTKNVWLHPGIPKLMRWSNHPKLGVLVLKTCLRPYRVWDGFG